MNFLVGIGAAIAILSAAQIASADTVKVGLIMSASGGFARWGEQTTGAIKIYQDQHGKSVNGHDIEILLRDDGGPDPSRAKQLAEELILRDKINILAGFAFTPNAMAVADLITEAKMPTIITNAATVAILAKSPYYVRLSYTLPQVTTPEAEWALKAGIKKVATMVADYGPGLDAEGAFIARFKAGGGTIVESIRVPLSTTDFSPFFERVLNDKPDAMFMFGPGGPSSLGMIQTWASRLKPAGIQLLLTGEMQQIDMPKMGPAALGVVSAYMYTENDPNPINKALWDAWRKDHAPKDSVPDIATVEAYDMMQLVYATVAKFGSSWDSDQVMAYWKGFKIASPRGPILIDPDSRDVVQNIYMRKVQDRDGTLVNVNFDQFDMVRYPAKDAK